MQNKEYIGFFLYKFLETYLTASIGKVPANQKNSAALLYNLHPTRYTI